MVGPGPAVGRLCGFDDAEGGFPQLLRLCQLHRRWQEDCLRNAEGKVDGVWWGAMSVFLGGGGGGGSKFADREMCRSS